MGKIILLQGNYSSLPTVGSDSDTVYYCNDTGFVFKSVGIGLPLVQIDDITRLVNDAARTSIQNPIDSKFYFVKSSKLLWYYDKTNGWEQVSSGSSGTGTVKSVNNQSPDNLGNVLLTTTNIDDSTDKRYVTDIELSNLTNLKTVATSGSYSDLTDKPDLTLKADLVNGIVPNSQLPSYVDNIVEVSTYSSLPTTGEINVIYVTQDTNLTYRWTGTTYIEISKSLALGETSNSAYRGDYGKIAYDHSQTTGNPHNTTYTDVGADQYGSAASAVSTHNSDLDAHSTLFLNKVNVVVGKGLSTVDFTDTNYVHTDNNYTTAEKTKLSGIQTGAEVNVNANWNSTSGDSQILNKPNLSTVATSGSYNDLNNKPTSSTTSIDTAVSNSHTHSNKTVLDGLTDSNGILNYNSSSINVQADWSETDNTKQSYINNKPSNVVSDSSYVHTDNNYTTTEKEKLSNLSNYTLPVASTTTLGGIKSGTGVVVASDGTLNVTGATTGTVTAVNGILPDTSGNVTLGVPQGIIYFDEAKNKITSTSYVEQQYMIYTGIKNNLVISFYLCVNAGDNTTDTAYAQIYVNGSPAGSEHVVTNDWTSPIKCTDTIFINTNDRVSIYAKSGSGYEIWTSQFIVSSVIINNKTITDITSNSGNILITNSSTTSSTISDLDLSSTGVTSGSYTNVNLTVDSKGRITTVSDGESSASASYNWVSGTIYSVGAIVINNETIYICKNDNSDTTFTSSNWTQLTNLSNGTTSFIWTANLNYIVGALVIYNGYLYVCNTANSDSTWTSSYWTQVSSNSGSGISTWIASTSYSVGNLVIYNNNIYQCLTANSDSTWTIAHWQIIGSSSSETVYQATVSSNSVTATISGYNVGTIYYLLLSSAITASATLSINSGTAYSLVDINGNAIKSALVNSVLPIYQASSTSNYQCLFVYDQSGDSVPPNGMISLNDSVVFSTVKSAIDSNGIYTVVTLKRKNGTNIITSTLSGGTSPEYTTRTEVYYSNDGTTVLYTYVYTITYDNNGNIESEVINS